MLDAGAKQILRSGRGNTKDLFRNNDKGRSCSAQRSISLVVVIKTVAPIELVPHARCFAALRMTGLYFEYFLNSFFIVILEQA